MASEKDAATCASDPNFAIICSFLQKFSKLLNIQQPEIHLLQIWLENTDEVPGGLKELHIKLLRKLRKTVHETAWESALVKFCYSYSSQDAWEIERFTYKKSSLKVKLRILRELLESQFERNGKFRAGVSTLTADELRSQPLGRDKLGHAYWLTQDLKCNLRIYQEHLDEEIWQVVASNKEEVASLICRLKGNEVVLSSCIVDEDSSSNSCPVAIIKLPPPEQQDDSQASKTNGSSTEEKVPNITIKLDRSTNGTAKNVKVKEQLDEDDNQSQSEEEEIEGEEEEEDYEEEENGEEEHGDEEEEEEDAEVAVKTVSITDEEKFNITVKINENVALNMENNEENCIKDDVVDEVKLDKDEKLTITDVTNGVADIIDERKVKPIVISKVVSIIDETPSKKRALDADTSLEAQTESKAKKSRPTLLDSNREKNISKYEKYSTDDDDGEEEEEEENGEEEEDEKNGEEEEDEKNVDEEEDDDEKDCDGDDVIIEKSKCKIPPPKDEEAGEEIVEEVLVIRCDGTAKENKENFLDVIKLGCELPKEGDDDDIVGEAIEEDVILVCGEGSGQECLVGNPKEETEKPSFFFGQPGCLKLSPVKTSGASSMLIKSGNISSKTSDIIQNCTDKVKEEDTELIKLKNGKKCTLDNDNLSNPSSANTDTKDANSNTKISENTAAAANERSTLSDEDSNKNIPESKISDNDIKKDDEDEVPAIPKSPVPIIKVTEASTDEVKVEKSESVANNDGNMLKAPEIPKEICERPGNIEKSKVICDDDPLKNASASRKRRLSGEKARLTSESETDLNSENIEEETENDQDIGGKRLKMRPKIVNTGARKKIEEQRKIKGDKEESSSEEDGRTSEIVTKNLSPDNSLDIKQSNIVDNDDSKAKNDQKKGKDASPLSRIKVMEKDTPAKEIVESVSTSKTSPAEKEITQNTVQIRRGRSMNSAVQVLTIPVKVKKARKAKTSPVEEPQSSEDSTDNKKKKRSVEEPPLLLEANTENKKPILEPEVKPIESKSPEIKSEIPNLTPQLPIPATVPSISATPRKIDKMPKLEAEASAPTPSKGKQMKTPQQKKQRRKREIDASNIIDTESETTPVRQSRRIAQLKIREEAERRKLEEVALKKMKEELHKKKKEENPEQEYEISDISEPEPEPEEPDSDVELKKKLEKKKKTKKKGQWSSGSEEEDDEEEELEPEYDPGSPLFKSDHEFSPESEIEDESQVVPMKRARTARKDGESPGDSAAENLEESCQKCGKKDHPEWILLCDKCDKGYHCSCLSPVLFYIPEGDWFCPPCEQEKLIEALEQHLKDLDELLRKNEIEEKIRLENLEIAKKQENEVKEKPEKQPRRRRPPKSRKNSSDDDDDDCDSSSRSSSSSSGSSDSDSDDEHIYKLRKRRQMNVSYRFHEYDDLINSAIKKEMDEVAGAGNLGRGKDISTIIEADKEEKMRQKQIDAQVETGAVSSEIKEEKLLAADEEEKPKENSESISVKPNEVTEDKEVKPKEQEEDSGSDFTPVRNKPKMSAARLKRMRKKNRKLNSLDISSGDDESDEDFKTSSYETEDDEESISAHSDSDSSLEVYKRRNKKSKKGKRNSRRATRERRKRFDDDFIVEDSDASEEFPRIKKKRKDESDYSESGTDDELSEDVDSDDLCDDSTDSDESDGAWRPGKRKKQRKAPKKKQHTPQKKFGGAKKKIKRRDPDDYDDDERSFKGNNSKKKRDDYDSDSPDSGRRTRGRRFVYLEDYDDESSDDGIKPGVKRPDTPPEEREQFIRKQEEIKRMLAEKNTEAAKAAATPKLTPIPNRSTGAGGDSLSTVPLSVIKSAKALDIDYLQRKGELDSDDPETDFDDDLPDDFNPEDMDEEAIAKMMEEEDFANQQLKVSTDVVRPTKKPKDTDILTRPEVELLRIPKPPQLQHIEPVRKRFPMPTIQPPLGGMGMNRGLPLGGGQGSILMSPSHRNLIMNQNRESLIPTTVLSVQTAPNIQQKSQAPVATGMSGTQPVPNPHNLLPNEPLKPRGRRKKITPLRDPLQKQQAAAAAAAAAVAAASGKIQEKTPPPQPEKPTVAQGSNLSVAQPPQLYKPPTSTQPSVITRMPQPPRARFPDRNSPSRYYAPPNQLTHRPPPRHPGITIHPMRPSYASGPPPLRSVNNNGPPSATVANAISRLPPPRQPPPFSTSEPFAVRPSHPNNPPPHAYRPPLFGTPGYPPAPPPTQPTSGPAPPRSHAGGTEYQRSYGPAPFNTYFPPPPPMGATHSTPPPPSAAAVVAGPGAVPVTSPPTPVQQTPAIDTLPPVSRPTASALETFDSKATPPLETDSRQSPFTAPQNDDNGDEAEAPRLASTSEFSGLVSYFSSQQDDFNT